jgi:hypothetical protein
MTGGGELSGEGRMNESLFKLKPSSLVNYVDFLGFNSTSGDL